MQRNFQHRSKSIKKEATDIFKPHSTVFVSSKKSIKTFANTHFIFLLFSSYFVAYHPGGYSDKIPWSEKTKKFYAPADVCKCRTGICQFST